ncbi:MAG TPA: pirin family protein, partial [Burkholderiales bacterium]|nr:pirin family protein [Burkholderiales bacterium]
MTSNDSTVLKPHTKDLGDLAVRRLLPAFPTRMIGPFIFFDHMGPADFAPGRGIDVRPHPHIGLATVTYLFEGNILHRDSLGSVQLISPGDVNWMTAGSGIVHSERTSPEDRTRTQRLHGIQSWIALPKAHER